MRHQVLSFKVAFCTAIFFMCSSLSQSINVNSKHAAAHINKKIHPNGLALLPDADLTIDQEGESDDDEEEDDGKSEADYSNEYDQVSSGSDNFGHPDDFDRTNALPFFHKVPENAFIFKGRQAILKCKATHALDVSWSCLLSNILLHCHFADCINNKYEIIILTCSLSLSRYSPFLVSFSCLSSINKSTAGFSMSQRHKNQSTHEQRIARESTKRCTNVGSNGRNFTLLL